MSRSRGEPPRALIDRKWPHQVALVTDRCTGKNFQAPHDFLRGRSVYALHGSVTDGERNYHVFRFKEPEDALQFKNAFDGIPFYPEDHVGKRWKRPPGDVRRPAKIDPYDWR